MIIFLLIFCRRNVTHEKNISLTNFIQPIFFLQFRYKHRLLFLLNSFSVVLLYIFFEANWFRFLSWPFHIFRGPSVCFPISTTPFLKELRQIFYFLWQIILSFLSCGFDDFPFLTTPFLLYLSQILDTAGWKQPTSFTTFHCWLHSWINFMIRSIVSIDSSFVGVMFPSNHLCPTIYRVSARIILTAEKREKALLYTR